MLLQYEFKLPPAFDMNAIRRRIEDKRHLFDRHVGLVWKAWLLADSTRQAGQENRYAPLYLFAHAAAARDFLFGPLYAGVSQTFGWVHPSSGPLVGTCVPALQEARSCTLRIVDVKSHAGLLAHGTRALPPVPGLLARATMFDIGQLQLREYCFWDLDPATIAPPSEGGVVYEVGAVSMPSPALL